MKYSQVAYEVTVLNLAVLPGDGGVDGRMFYLTRVIYNMIRRQKIDLN